MPCRRNVILSKLFDRLPAEKENIILPYSVDLPDIIDTKRDLGQYLGQFNN